MNINKDGVLIPITFIKYNFFSYKLSFGLILFTHFQGLV